MRNFAQAFLMSFSHILLKGIRYLLEQIGYFKMLRAAALAMMTTDAVRCFARIGGDGAII